MGRTLALELARRGCHLALSDVNEAGLAETAQLATKLGVKVTTAKVNVAKRDEMGTPVAVARVEERIAVYREAGWPVPEELKRFQRDLMTELMAESQGR